MRPPQFLQIVKEKIRSGEEQAYGSVEQALLYACRTLGAPNRYLALVSLGKPTEVWWLNEYDSRKEIDRIAEAYATNSALMAALREISPSKEALRDVTADLVMQHRPDLSGHNPWRVGELGYVTAQELREPAKSEGAVFEAPNGKHIVLKAAADLDGAELLAQRLGDGARVLAVEPKWSFPKDAWTRANPQLWKP